MNLSLGSLSAQIVALNECWDEIDDKIEAKRLRDLISNFIQRLETIKDTAEDCIEQIQSQCAHIGVVVKHCGNTGNYDPSADCYWVEYLCPTCEKNWSDDKKYNDV